MNVAGIREQHRALCEQFECTRLAEHLERTRLKPNPDAPNLSCVEHHMLIEALWTITLTFRLPLVGRHQGAVTYAQVLYTAMRMDGTGHALAEMLALQAPPMSNTDREFLEGYCNGNQFEKTPAIGDYYKKKAAAAGVDTTGKVYMSGLALEPGDPAAWVSGRGDVERVAKMRGMSVQGSVNVKAQDLGPPPEDVTVADDLVDDRVADLIEERPELAERDPGELRHEVRETIKPHWGE